MSIEDFVEEVMGYFLSWFMKPYLSTKRVVLVSNLRLIQTDKNLDCLVLGVYTITLSQLKITKLFG